MPEQQQNRRAEQPDGTTPPGIFKEGIKMVKMCRQSWNGLYSVLTNSGDGWRYVLKNAEKQTAEQLFIELSEN